jgi:hypothetical protein
LEADTIHSGWRIAPPINPALRLMANTTPTGIDMDWNKVKFKDTDVAFCTEIMPIALTKIASIKLMASKGIVFITVDKLIINLIFIPNKKAKYPDSRLL